MGKEGLKLLKGGAPYTRGRTVKHNGMNINYHVFSRFTENNRRQALIHKREWDPYEEGIIGERMDENMSIILCFHGFLASGGQFYRLGSYLKHYILICPDLPLHGLTTEDVPNATWIDENVMAEVGRVVLETEKISRIVDVLAYSMGGLVAMKFCALYPRLVRRIILCSPAGFMPNLLHPAQKLRKILHVKKRKPTITSATRRFIDASLNMAVKVSAIRSSKEEIKNHFLSNVVCEDIKVDYSQPLNGDWRELCRRNLWAGIHVCAAVPLWICPDSRKVILNLANLSNGYDEYLEEDGVEKSTDDSSQTSNRSCKSLYRGFTGFNLKTPDKNPSTISKGAPTLPILFLWGEDDTVVPLQYAGPILFKLFPGMLLKVYPKLDHLLFEPTSLRYVAKDIVTFLNYNLNPTICECSLSNRIHESGIIKMATQREFPIRKFRYDIRATNLTPTLGHMHYDLRQVPIGSPIYEMENYLRELTEGRDGEWHSYIWKSLGTSRSSSPVASDDIINHPIKA